MLTTLCITHLFFVQPYVISVRVTCIYIHYHIVTWYYLTYRIDGGFSYMEEFTVREIAKHIGESEESIKRRVRSGKFPNAYMNSDRRIPKSDFIDPLIDSQAIIEPIPMV